MTQKVAEEPEGEASAFLSILLAVIEFDMFVQMMQDAKRIKIAEA